MKNESVFWTGFNEKRAASAKIKTWLARKKRLGGVESFLRKANLKGFSGKGFKSTSAGRSIR